MRRFEAAYLPARVEMHVMLAVLSGCDRDALDDPAAVESWLQAMVAAGAFSLFALKVTRFSPQGVTGVAVVGESHLAVHTWPEEGRLFVDIATCGEAEGARRALDALAAVCGHASLEISEVRYGVRSGFGPPRSALGRCLA